MKLKPEKILATFPILPHHIGMQARANEAEGGTEITCGECKLIVIGEQAVHERGCRNENALWRGGRWLTMYCGAPEYDGDGNEL